MQKEQQTQKEPLLETDVIGSDMEFQIEQNWGDGCKGWEYFKAIKGTSINDLKRMAIAVIRKDWEKSRSAPRFSAPTPCRPTIYIYEWFDGKKVKNGVRLKTQWR